MNIPQQYFINYLVISNPEPNSSTVTPLPVPVRAPTRKYGARGESKRIGDYTILFISKFCRQSLKRLSLPSLPSVYRCTYYLFKIFDINTYYQHPRSHMVDRAEPQRCRLRTPPGATRRTKRTHRGLTHVYPKMPLGEPRGTTRPLTWTQWVHKVDRAALLT